jgi:hypothetical protein
MKSDRWLVADDPRIMTGLETHTRSESRETLALSPARSPRRTFQAVKTRRAVVRTETRLPSLPQWGLTIRPRRHARRARTARTRAPRQRRAR